MKRCAHRALTRPASPTTESANHQQFTASSLTDDVGAADLGISGSYRHRWLQWHRIEAGENLGQTQARQEVLREFRRKVRVLEEEQLILRSQQPLRRRCWPAASSST